MLGPLLVRSCPGPCYQLSLPVVFVVTLGKSNELYYVKQSLTMPIVSQLPHGHQEISSSQVVCPPLGKAESSLKTRQPYW